MAGGDIDVDKIVAAVVKEAERQRKEKSGQPGGTAQEGDGDISPEVASRLLDGISPEDLELTADTFNPDAMWDDKSQAERFGNTVVNASKDALKGIISQANKLPRWVWVLVLLVGAMIGFAAALWMTGALSGHAAAAAGSSTGTGSNLPLPPPPNFGGTSTTTTTGGG